jgi:predicted signal transduction protein with EAL and GGDEF domain
VETSAGPLFVSMSAGALSVSLSSSNRDIDHILQRADAALYRAKRGGRDKAVVDAGHGDGAAEPVAEISADQAPFGRDRLLYGPPRLSLPA